MFTNDTSDKLLAHNGLNSTYLPSTDTFHTQHDYSLRFGDRSSYIADRSNATATTSSTRYNSTNGYGTINAAAAVARAIGQNTFADVPKLGGDNWGADLIKAPEVWAKGYTGKDIVVAVLDTGVDYNHKDLKNNIWRNPREIPGNYIDDDNNGYVDDSYGWNFFNNNNNTLDKVNGHGTHVAGTIAGEKNNYGVTGIAYNAKIMPVKVTNDTSPSALTTRISLANGIYYAVDNGANVINVSLSSPNPNCIEKSAIDYASSKGVTVVMAAGNDGSPLPDYPARFAYKSGIAVGAVDRNNNLADFSNRAGTNEITYVTAPGAGVYSSYLCNQYETANGTSAATPHVAGVVALMLSANPNLTAEQVRQMITDTAGSSTQTTVSSLNNSDVGSLKDQALTQTRKYPTPETISNLNNSALASLVSQAIAQNSKYLTDGTISNLNNSYVDSLMDKSITQTKNYVTSLEDNDKLANSELWPSLQDYEKV